MLPAYISSHELLEPQSYAYHLEPPSPRGSRLPALPRSIFLSNSPACAGSRVRPAAA
ncbi:hypothetical protein RB213_012576 [Colletotrichum asianum]